MHKPDFLINSFEKSASPKYGECLCLSMSIIFFSKNYIFLNVFKAFFKRRCTLPRTKSHNKKNFYEYVVRPSNYSDW